MASTDSNTRCLSWRLPSGGRLCPVQTLLEGSRPPGTGPVVLSPSAGPRLPPMPLRPPRGFVAVPLRLCAGGVGGCEDGSVNSFSKGRHWSSSCGPPATDTNALPCMSFRRAGVRLEGPMHPETPLRLRERQTVVKEKTPCVVPELSRHVARMTLGHVVDVRGFSASPYASQEHFRRCIILKDIL